MNLFDGYQRSAFSVVVTTMGYETTWQPSGSGPLQAATVLFKDASDTAKILDIEYDPQRAMIEYFNDQFTGLKTSVDNKNDEYLTVNGVSYGVNEIVAKYDGKILIAYLQLA